MTFGTPHRHFDECESTNDLARAWTSDAADPAPHGALVTAAFQTRGRGQRGRRWEAGAGESALMSFVARPALSLGEGWRLGFAAALAVADALDEFCSPIMGGGVGDTSARLKWPNDVLLGAGKVAGVLIESAAGAAILGIGVNVAQERFSQSERYVYPPTSLRIATGQGFPVEAVIQAVATHLARRVGEAERDFGTISDGWQARLAVGATVRRGLETATLAAVGPDGAASVRLPDGTFTRWRTVDGENDAFDV